MSSAPTIVEFVTDPQLLGLSLSAAQETLLRSIYGLPLSEDQMELWRACTGREDYRGEPFTEVTVVAGARAGKDSMIAAPIVVYEALFGGHEEHLSRGERGMVPLVAQDSRAATIAFGYVRGYLEGSDLLAKRIKRVLSREIELTNSIVIGVFPSTLRSLRGWSIPVGVMDELGFYRLEGMADSDAEIQASLRRGQLTFPAPKLLKISTPYMKSGVLWEDFSKHYAADNPDLLVWKASSILMNPVKVDPKRLEQMKRLDPIRYAREFEAEFSDDLASFLPWQWIQEAIVEGRYELSPRAGMKYYAAVDPSGGGADAFTLSIVHTEGQGDDRPVVQDVLRGWSRRGGRSPELVGVVHEIAGTCKQYRCHTVVGDRYAAGWVRQAFEKAGIKYVESKLNKSAAYLEALPLFSTGRIRLLDHKKLVRELQCLERRTRAGGRDVIDHPHGGHDDHANVLALAAVSSVQTKRQRPARTSRSYIAV